MSTATSAEGLAELSGRTYFLDESGNSGDLAHPGERFDFDRQEVFVLVAVGVEDPSSLDSPIADLKRRFRVQAPELKSTSVRDKPGVVTDLVELLGNLDAHILAEVVDKRYFIAVHIITSLVLPPIPGRPLDPQTLWVSNHLAEYLAKAPVSVFRMFVRACQAPSGGAIEAAFRSILVWLGQSGHKGEIAYALRDATGRGLQEFLDERPALPETQARWLPLPDPSLSGSPLWILPNLSSFANLYARINRVRSGKLATVNLVHDEQRYYEHVLESGKRTAEGLSKRGLAPGLHRADWDFREVAALQFQPSNHSTGIQAADVLAGFLMRYVRNALYGSSPPTQPGREAFDRIVGPSDADSALGVNFVLSNAGMRRLRLLPMSDPWIRP